MIILAAVVCVSLLAMPALATNATASLDGPGVVRAGDTITLTFKLNGTDILGASGTISYDKSQLTLKSTAVKVHSPWMVDFNNEIFVAYDNEQDNPINKSTSLFTVTFKVDSSLKAGTKITVSCEDVCVTTGDFSYGDIHYEETKIGTVSYSATIAPPKSTDNSLNSMTVSNATISPAFSPDVTQYTASVPYSVEKLEISAKANDSAAKVSVSSPPLKPGGSTVATVTVTAENGAERVYTIVVEREQDPNYVASDNCFLATIEVEGFLLSPVFRTDVTEYVVWLPYEVEQVNVTAKAAHPLATVKVTGGSALVAGQDNEITIVCKAEDGTERTYKVIAKRAASHDEQPTQPPQPTEPIGTTVPPQPTQPDTQPETKPVPVETVPNAPVQNNGGDRLHIDWWFVVIIGVLCLAFGLALGLFIGLGKRDAQEENEDEPDEVETEAALPHADRETAMPIVPSMEPLEKQEPQPEPAEPEQEDVLKDFPQDLLKDLPEDLLRDLLSEDK